MLRFLLLLVAALPLCSATSMQDLERAIVGIDTKMRIINNKLHRHESRSRQVNEMTTKTLRAIVTQTAGQSKNVESIAVYMAKMEGRLIKMEQALQKNDRKMGQVLELLQRQQATDLTARSAAGASDSDEVIRKLDTMDGTINDRLNGLLSEAITSRETVTSHLQRQDGMMNDISNSLASAAGFSAGLQQTQGQLQQTQGQLQQTQDQLQQTAAQLQETEQKLAKNTVDGEKILTEFSVGVSHLIDNTVRLGNDSLRVADDVSLIRQDLRRLEQEMDARQVELFSTHYQTNGQQSSDMMGEIKHDIDHVANVTAVEIAQLRTEMKETGAERDRLVNSQVETLKAGQTQLTNMVQESMAMAENLYDRVNDGYSELKKEIQGLSNLEEVMVDTADSVLDTKRRLEYGVQQILLEVEAAVRAQGIKINGTFSTKFGSISEQILANQSLALHNMTKSIEAEIAQVWRQIGVMYQTLSSSAQVLDKIDDKTTQYVNGTLEKTEKVDGTVGDVAKRVGEVEENLNFLLGRLSLVVSEFNHMKSGIGAELDLLRTKFKTFGPDGEATGEQAGEQVQDLGPSPDEDARKVPIQ